MSLFVSERPWEQAQSQRFSLYSETGRRTRRVHSKSRDGCKNCKQRHIRCDGRRPSCSYCVRNHRHCERTPALTGAPIPVPKRSAVSVRTLVERRILQHLDGVEVWDGSLACFNKYARLHAHESLEHFFLVDEPWLKTPETQKAMQHHASDPSLWRPYLLHAILAVSTAHMASHKSDSRTYWMASTTHWQHSLGEYARAMRAPLEAEDADALFFAGMLHSMMSVLYSSMSVDDLGWITSMQGNHLLLKIPRTRERLFRGMWKPVIDEYQHWQLETPVQGASPLDDTPFSSTAALSEYFMTQNDPNGSRMYRERIAALTALEGRSNTARDIGGIASFVTEAPPEYLDAVKSRDFQALLLLYSWCTLFGRINQWWITRSTVYGRKSIAVYLREHADASIQEALDAIAPNPAALLL